MNPAAAQPSPGYAAVNLRPRSIDASSPRRAAFLSLAKATKVEPGNAEGTVLVRLHNDRAGLRVGHSSTGVVLSVAGVGYPRHLSETPHDSVCNFTNTHEAGASSVSTPARAGAFIRNLGCSVQRAVHGTLPPLSFKAENLAHALSPVGSGPRKTEPNSGGFAWPQELFAKS